MPATYTDRLQGLTASVALKAPVYVRADANVTLSGLQTIQGLPLTDNQRVLVSDNANPVENGIYNAHETAWTRALDFDGARDVVEQTIVYVSDGDYATKAYYVTTANPIYPGTTAIVFAELPGGAGGSSIPPTEFSLIGDGVTSTFSLLGISISAPTAYIVRLSGVTQEAASDYTVNNVNDTITFTSPPPDGVEIHVRVIGFQQAINVADGSLVQAAGSTVPRTLSDRFADTINVKDYGVVADFSYQARTGTDNAAALAAAIASASDGDTIVFPPGYILSTAPLSWAGKSLRFLGPTAGATHLVFNDCNGIVCDNTGINMPQLIVENLTFSTTANGLYTAIDYTVTHLSSPRAANGTLANCCFIGADRMTGVPWPPNAAAQKHGWLGAIKLTGTDWFLVDNCYGDGAETAFTDGWPQATVFINLDTCQGVNIRSTHALFYETGVKIRGSSEGCRILDCDLVANRYGFDIVCDTAPANQHVIGAGTHISSYDYNVNLNVGGTQPIIALWVTDTLFFKRSTSVTAGFKHIKADVGPAGGCFIARNHFFDGAAIDPVASADITIDLIGGNGTIVAGNLFYRQAVCVNIAAACVNTNVYGNVTRDDGGTILAAFITDAGTFTHCFDNNGDRYSDVVQMGGSRIAVFRAGQHEFHVANGQGLEITNVGGSLVNHLRILPSATGAPVAVGAVGDDADIDFQLSAKGTGRVRFGAHTATGDTATNGYIEIKDAAGNTRRLATVL